MTICKQLPDVPEDLEERQLSTEIHYLAVVADDKTLLRRMREGRGITDQGWIDSSMRRSGRWKKAWNLRISGSWTE